MAHPLWQQLARDAGTALTDAQTQQLDRYLDELVAWNQKLNLTRIVDRADAEVRHVADALTLLPFLPPLPPGEGRGEGASERRMSSTLRESSQRAPARALSPNPSPSGRGGPITLADVGTGGGVPGVPLAIARPDLRVTLIDSTAKKLNAIAQMCAAVGATNVTTLHSRIEAVPEKFDVITARAVADLDTLLGWCEPLMRPRSTLLALKGPKADEEIAAIDPRRRKRFKIDVTPIDVEELAGHRVVRVRKA